MSFGYGKDIDWSAILEIVRTPKHPALVTIYEASDGKCPQCPEKRKSKSTPKGFCTDACLKHTLGDLFEAKDGEKLKVEIATIYAKKHGLRNGQPLHFIGQGYRNENLYFWDAKSGSIVYPFTEYDDYGSVPPNFVVGNNDFNPEAWLNSVDHNSAVFPSKVLLKELREFLVEHPDEVKCVVEINGKEYFVRLDDVDVHSISSAIIGVGVGSKEEKKKEDRGFAYTLFMAPGRQSWRLDSPLTPLSKRSSTRRSSKSSGSKRSESKRSGSKRSGSRRSSSK